MAKLFLLDAYALIYRAYYGFIKNPRINSKGENTSAVLGFVNTLEEILTKENPEYIGGVGLRQHPRRDPHEGESGLYWCRFRPSWTHIPS